METEEETNQLLTQLSEIMGTDEMVRDGHIMAYNVVEKICNMFDIEFNRTLDVHETDQLLDSTWSPSASQRAEIRGIFSGTSGNGTKLVPPETRSSKRKYSTEDEVSPIIMNIRKRKLSPREACDAYFHNCGAQTPMKPKRPKPAPIELAIEREDQEDEFDDLSDSFDDALSAAINLAKKKP